MIANFLLFRWTAVCRGALTRAIILNANEGGGIMRASIVSRVVRSSYGIVRTHLRWFTQETSIENPGELSTTPSFSHNKNHKTDYEQEIIEPFDPAVHSLEDKQYIPSIGAECAVNQMHWYIRAVRTSQRALT
jgi:hypothetical protein